MLLVKAKNKFDSVNIIQKTNKKVNTISNLISPFLPIINFKMLYGCK